MTDENIRDLWRSHDDVIDFARAIEQLVREECAVICEKEANYYKKRLGVTPINEIRSETMLDAAKAIRARGKNE